VRCKIHSIPADTIAKIYARIDMKHSPTIYAVIQARSDAIASRQPVFHTLFLLSSSKLKHKRRTDFRENIIKAIEMYNDINK